MEDKKSQNLSSAVATEPGGDLAHITQELYKQNLAMAETNRTLSLLRKIDEIVLNDVRDAEKVAQEVAQSVAVDSGFSYVAIYLRDARNHQLKPAAISNKSGKISELEAQTRLMPVPISLKVKDSPVDKAIKNKMITTCNDLSQLLKDNVPPAEAKQIQSSLAISTFFICPLESRDDLLGVMVIGSRNPEASLSFYEKSLIERLTVAIGIALDNTLLYAQAQDAAKRLRTANRHLKELDRAKDEFISMASHQLRTPLTSIKGYLSMLLEGDAGKVSNQQHEFLDYAYGGAQRMVNLISDLLNVSRMSAGKFMIEKAPVDLVAVVAEEVQQLQQHAESKELTLSFKKPAVKLPLVEVDEGKTRQVIMNFIDNAIYYTRAGSVKVSLEQKGNSVELRVKDSGIGVPKAARDHLFTKFFRAENAQGVRPDGTGLGLFLAKRVIEDQGGTIIFESTEGKGSTFGFSMPIKERVR